MALVDAELATARAGMETILSDTCTVSRPGAKTYTDSGGWTVGAATVTSVVCRIASVSQRDIIRAGRLAEEADGVLTVPYDADVDSGDQVTVNGASYEVLALPVDRSETLVLRRFVRAVI